jgi:hypothetical protein
MALVAEDAADRVRQLITIAKELTAYALSETEAIKSRRSPPEGRAAQDNNIQLANAFRMEMGHIEANPALVALAPKAELAKLKAACIALEAASSGHRDALAALKMVSEGLLQAMAEEVARQRGASAVYGAGGDTSQPKSLAVALDKRA